MPGMHPSTPGSGSAPGGTGCGPWPSIRGRDCWSTDALRKSQNQGAVTMCDGRRPRALVTPETHCAIVVSSAVPPSP